MALHAWGTGRGPESLSLREQHMKKDQARGTAAAKATEMLGIMGASGSGEGKGRFTVPPLLGHDLLQTYEDGCNFQSRLFRAAFLEHLVVILQERV